MKITCEADREGEEFGTTVYENIGNMVVVAEPCTHSGALGELQVGYKGPVDLVRVLLERAREQLLWERIEDLVNGQPEK